MAVEATHRPFGGGRIVVDRVRTQVRRETGGWYNVLGPTGAPGSWVLYRPSEDLAVLDWTDSNLRISFQQGEARFPWRGLDYRIESMALGRIRILQDDHVAVRGVVTVRGVRLDEIAPELMSIIRELAWALTLRSEALAQEYRSG